MPSQTFSTVPTTQQTMTVAKADLATLNTTTVTLVNVGAGQYVHLYELIISCLVSGNVIILGGTTEQFQMYMLAGDSLHLRFDDNPITFGNGSDLKVSSDDDSFSGYITSLHRVEAS